jgi:hypothetical protein
LDQNICYGLHQEKNVSQGSSVAICALLLATLAACTGTTVRPSDAQQIVPKTYTVAMVGDITAGDELWRTYTIEARRQFVSELGASQAFSQVSDSAPPPGARVVIVTGQITEVDKGSPIARLIVGLGAGRAHITADFQLKDSSGASLGTYSVRKTYAGGVGIGGAGLLDMDDLAQKLGNEAADSLADWAKTGRFASR